MMKTSEVLALGRERIARGWVRYHYELDGGYCMSGAIMEGAHHAAMCLLAETVLEMFPGGAWANYYGRSMETLVSFNDFPGRTQEEVLSVFDKAILSAQERGD